MNTRNRQYTMIRWILALALLAMPVWVVARDTPEPIYGEEWDQPENFSDEYQSGDYGRILSADQGGRVIHENPEPTEPPEESVSRNAPVFPGDRILTAAHQRVEVELAGGSLVRLDDGTELLFQALPDPYAGYRDNTILNLTAGSLQIRTMDLGEDTFRVDTPSASIYLLGDGEFRIDLLSSGETVVRSRRGVAEMSGDGGSVLVRSGMESVAYAGAYPTEPASYSTSAADSFDRWVRSRDESLRARAGAGNNPDYDDEVVYESLPTEVQPYYRELSGNGRWTYANDYGWVWYPSEVEVGWRPYLAGHWSYGPRGYFWVSNENWGWAPYHYGRWDHLAGYGWCWIPGRVFGGAWVSWSWGSAYVGWAPLNYWNRPVFYGPRYGDYYCGGSWTFIGYNHFHNNNYYSYHVGAGQAYRDGHRGAIVTRPPRVGPRELARDGGSRDRAVRYARDNDLNRGDRGLRERDGTAVRPTTTARRFRDTENRVLDGARRRPVDTRRATRTDREAPARTGYTAVDPRRNVRPSRGGSGGNTGVVPRSTRVGSGERQTMSRTGQVGSERARPATEARPAARPQREKPVYRRPEADSGNRVRDLYRGVSRQRDGQSTDRRPTRATTPGRQPGSSQAPSAATTPRRTVRPSAPANRTPPSSSRSAPRSPSTPSARPAPGRSTQPPRKAAPQKSSEPQKPATSRSSGSRSKPSSSSRPSSSSGKTRPSRSRGSEKKK